MTLPGNTVVKEGGPAGQVPRVSVVMPAYNRAGLIGASIDSVLAQSEADFELIIVDDGSTDDTCAVVSRYADPRIRLLQLSHRGLGHALNTAVAACRAPYFARLDSDDLWTPEFLAVSLAAMEQPPRVGVVYGRGVTFSADSTAVQADRGMPLCFPDRPFESLLLRDHLTCSALVRVECFRQAGGFNESIRWWEDWDFWLRVSRHCAFRFVDKELLRIRVHDTNLSGQQGLEAWATRTQVLDRIFADLPELSPELTAIRALAYRNAHFDVGLNFLQQHAWRAALGQFADGLRASRRPAAAVARLAYLVGLHYLGNSAAFRHLHRRASRLRQRLRQL